jgi:hypothetical protein
MLYSLWWARQELILAAYGFEADSSSGLLHLTANKEEFDTRR